MGFWSKLLQGLRIGGAVAASQGVKIKGVPIDVIAEEAEKDGAIIKDSVTRIKDAKKAPSKPGA